MLKSVLFLLATISALLPSSLATNTCRGKSWCCPRKGPDHLYLQRQQQNPYEILCDYGQEKIYKQCAYNATTGHVIPPTTKIDCPSYAAKHPYDVAFCPLTNPIHPNYDCDLCVTAPNCRDWADVEIQKCHGTNEQRFLYNRLATQIQVAGKNFCFDVGPQTPKEGTIVKVNTCNEKSPTQKWFYGLNNVFYYDSTNLVITRETNRLVLRKYVFGNSYQIWSSYP